MRCTVLIIYIIIALFGISLGLWAYCRKHPVLLLVFSFISIVAIAFFSHFNSQKVGNFISELQTKTRAENIKDLFQKELPEVALISACKPSEINDVTVDFTTPARMIFCLEDEIHVLTISKEGEVAKPQIKIMTKYVNYSGTRSGSSSRMISDSKHKTWINAFQGKYSFITLPVKIEKNKTYLKLIVFIPSQSNDVHLTVVENPAALENISGKYYVINVTIL